ncbi:MAG: alpha-L-fucosidase [Bacteroidales bacterium]|nr:alpha-L-fucosidase [Bacteroidales bacterium]
MKRILLLLSLAFVATSFRAQVLPTWESINQRGYPQWFSDAKLGIFIHWGVYSVPAFASKEGYAEWYYRGLMTSDDRKAFQERIYGKDFQYEDFVPMWKAELWNPDEWAELFEKSGAKYVLLVSKHHDGYCLWPSQYALGWNSVETGPHRDICGELTEAVRKHGLKMGFYYSLPEWTSSIHRWYVDPDDDIAEYVDTHMIPQFKELIERYKPTVLFTDGEWRNSAEQWHATELISWYYNTVGDDAIVNDRWGNGGQHGFRTPEYSAGITLTDRPWAECRGLGRSFGLNRNEPIENYMSSDELIRHFATLVAAGGGMTLNVGPAADGKIPLLQQERLLDLGKWLRINGEAIYGTRPFKKFYEMKPVTVARNDKQIDFDWKRNSPDPAISCDHFQAHWQGVFSCQADTYTFEIQTDDRARLLIDDQEVIGNVGKSSQGKMKLAAGQHKIEVFYEEDELEATIALFWSSKKMPKQIMEGFQMGAMLPAMGLKATYSCEQPNVCYTQKNGTVYAIALDYPQDELVLNLDRPDDSMRVNLLGCHKTLPWRYENGKLIIDTSGLNYGDLQSTAAWVFKLTQSGL